MKINHIKDRAERFKLPQQGESAAPSGSAGAPEQAHTPKFITYYVAYELPPREGFSFGATVPDMPGCFAGSDNSLDETLRDVAESMRAWICAELDMGHQIPEPSSLERILQLPDFDSGWKFAPVRVDVSAQWARMQALHKQGAPLADGGLLTVPSHLSKDIPPHTLRLLSRLSGIDFADEELQAHTPQVTLADC